MQHLGSMYTRHVNDRLGRDGALFRGRFRSRLIIDEGHLLATVRYIHRNPLDLPVSNVPATTDGRVIGPISVCGVAPVARERQRSRVGIVDDFDQFVETTSIRLPEPMDRCCVALIAAVELVLAEHAAPSDARAGAVARKVVLAWATNANVTPEATLMEVFDLPTAGTLRKASSRARKLLEAQPELSVVLDRVLDLVAGDWDNTGLTRVVL